MPRRILMGELVTRCKRRADAEGNDHIAADEWKALISEQYGDLYQTVANSGYRYFEYRLSYTTTGDAWLTEPDDHLATIGLYRVFPDGKRRELRELMDWQEANASGRTGDARAYALVDDRFYLYPAPPAGQTYELRYIPQATDLGTYADGQAVDVVTPDGEAFLLWGVAVKALAKSESDVTVAMAEREAARQRLAEWAVLRAFDQPRRPPSIFEDDGQYAECGDDLDYLWRRW